MICLGYKYLHQCLQCARLAPFAFQRQGLYRDKLKLYVVRVGRCSQHSALSNNINRLIGKEVYKLDNRLDQIEFG